MLEQRSIDYVPRAERHGKVWHQAPFWFTGNFVLPTLVIGFIGPELGLSALVSFLAIVLGAGVGTFFMAFHANQGPRMGLPQMIQSRAQFGSRGVILPFLATVFVYVGFMVFDVILATDGLALVLPDVRWFWYPVLTALSILIAVVGHDLLHLVQRWLTYVLIVAFAITTVIAFTLPAAPAVAATPGLRPDRLPGPVLPGRGLQHQLRGLRLGLLRYLPANSSAPKLIFFTYLGAAGSAIWLMGLGSLLASRLPEVDAVGSIKQVGDELFPASARSWCWCRRSR